MPRFWQRLIRIQTENALRDSLQTSAAIVREISTGLYIYLRRKPDRLILWTAIPKPHGSRDSRGGNQGREINEIFPPA